MRQLRLLIRQQLLERHQIAAQLPALRLLQRALSAFAPAQAVHFGQFQLQRAIGCRVAVFALRQRSLQVDAGAGAAGGMRGLHCPQVLQAAVALQMVADGVVLPECQIELPDNDLVRLQCQAVVGLALFQQVQLQHALHARQRAQQGCQCAASDHAGQAGQGLRHPAMLQHRAIDDLRSIQAAFAPFLIPILPRAGGGKLFQRLPAGGCDLCRIGVVGQQQTCAERQGARLQQLRRLEVFAHRTPAAQQAVRLLQ